MPSLDIVALDRTGTQALLPLEARCTTLEIPAGKSLSASVLCQRIKAALGLEVALLRAGQESVEVEVLDSSGVTPDRFRWATAPVGVTAACRTPWEQPGWFPSFNQEIDEALGFLGHQRTGPSVQARHWTLSAILRVPTDAGPVWVKAIPPAFAHEPTVLSLVASTGQTVAPTPLAVGNGWWMAKQFPRERPDPSVDILTVLAHVQVALAGRSELREASIPKRSLSEIPSLLRAIANRKDLVTGDSGRTLTASMGHLEDLSAAVDALNIPDTIVHSDFYQENTRWTEKGWMLFDWTDACVAHPFLDLALTIRDEGGRWVRRADAYAAPWRGVIGPSAVKSALSAAPVLAAAHQVINYTRIADAFPGVATSAMAEEVTRWVDRVNAGITSLERRSSADPRRIIQGGLRIAPPDALAIPVGALRPHLSLNHDTLGFG